MRIAPTILGAVSLALAGLTSGHVALNHGGFAAFLRKLDRGANARGELVVGHLPVT